MTIQRLQALQQKLADRGGLLAREWDQFDDLQKKLDPISYEKRQADGRRDINLQRARELSIKDLEMIMAEKRSI